MHQRTTKDDRGGSQALIGSRGSWIIVRRSVAKVMPAGAVCQAARRDVLILETFATGTISQSSAMFIANLHVTMTSDCSRVSRKLCNNFGQGLAFRSKVVAAEGRTAEQGRFRNACIRPISLDNHLLVSLVMCSEVQESSKHHLSCRQKRALAPNGRSRLEPHAAFA